MNWLKKNEDKKGQFIFSDYITEYAIMFLLFAFVSPIFGIFIVKVLNLDDAFADLGVYGDFLGGSTLPFLTIITIAFVYKTFKLQKEQLQTQKEEMEATRATLAEQNKTAQLQRFENSYFIQLKDLKDRLEVEIYDAYHELSSPLDHVIRFDLELFYSEMGTHVKNNLKAPKETKWKLYKDEMQRCFEEKKFNFSHPEFKKYIFSIMRCFQLLNRYKGIMEDDEVRYYLRYIIDEIGEGNYRLSMLYIIVYSEMYPDFFKAIKDLKLHEFTLYHEDDPKLTSALIFIKTAFTNPNLVWA